MGDKNLTLKERVAQLEVKIETMAGEIRGNTKLGFWILLAIVVLNADKIPQYFEFAKNALAGQ